jgi:hypothetical protein
VDPGATADPEDEVLDDELLDDDALDVVVLVEAVAPRVPLACVEFEADVALDALVLRAVKAPTAPRPPAAIAAVRRRTRRRVTSRRRMASSRRCPGLFAALSMAPPWPPGLAPRFGLAVRDL